MKFAFPSPPVITIPVNGGEPFPVRRIFCVGRNYADHVREMGGDPKKSNPVFFTKARDTLIATGASIPYPPATENLHYEGELYIAIGPNTQQDTQQDTAIFGYGCALDMTRRDLQAAAKASGKPWDMAKNFDHSAPIGPITRADQISLSGSRITTTLNGKVVQDAPLSHMIFSVQDIISALSQRVKILPGDIILTGTPSGVGPATHGDTIRVSVTGLSPVTVNYI